MLTLIDAEALADLGRYAARARALDDAGVIRLQATGTTLASWVVVLPGEGLLGVGAALGVRTTALAVEADVDLVVPLGAITDRVARPGVGRDLALPPVTAFSQALALTPPRRDWEPVGLVSGDALAQIGRDGVATISAAVAERGAAAGLVRDRVWQDVAHDRGVSFPAGAAFAAYALGFLAPGCEVSVFRSNRWMRLSAPGGHVLIR